MKLNSTTSESQAEVESHMVSDYERRATMLSNKETSVPQTRELRIESLPANVVSSITSSVQIISLQDVIIELVKNALDAQASSICVTISLKRGCCVVEDDGFGFAGEQLSTAEALAQPHYSSKTGLLNLHGYRGSFLVALGTLSTLTVASKLRGTDVTHFFTRHQGKRISLRKQWKDSNFCGKGGSGTRVTVNELFGNMPVRVKQRALLEQGNSKYAATIAELVHACMALLLAWPRDVSFSMQDTAGNKILHHIPREGDSRATSKTSSITIAHQCQLPRVRSPFPLLRVSKLLFGRDPARWIAVSGKTAAVQVHGYVSLDPAPVKSRQFVSLGVVPIESCPRGDAIVPDSVYDQINRIFAASSFGMAEDEGVADQEKEGRTKGNGYAGAELSLKQKRNRKALNQWPQFYLRITHPEKPYERIALETTMLQEQTRKPVQEVIEAVMTRFLSTHNFGQTMSPKKRKAQDSMGMGSPTLVKADREIPRVKLPRAISSDGSSSVSTRAPRAAPSSPKQACVRLPPANPSEQKYLQIRLRFPTMSDTQSPAPSILRSKIKGSHEPRHSTSDRSSQKDSASLFTEFIADSEEQLQMGRTCCCHSSSSRLSESSSDRKRAHSTIHEIGLRDGFDLSVRENNPMNSAIHHFRKLRKTQPRPNTPLPDFLCEWQNPVFDPGEAEISQLVPAYLNKPEASDHQHHQSPFKTRLSSFGQELSITRQDLADCTVLGQVDRKFILVLTRSPSPSLLIIDQHAADERLRVEALFDEICNLHLLNKEHELSKGSDPLLTTVHLDPPLSFQPELLEVCLLRALQADFALWGIALDTTDSRCTISTLPSLVAERYTSNPQAFFDMLRSEAWTRKPALKKSPSSGVRRGWIAALPDCPTGIVEMLKSRACRSAIMFNDELTMGECEGLVRRLAETRFPFSCAHGRRSVVPLVGLGNGGLGGVDEYAEARGWGGEGFEARFNDWQFGEMLEGGDSQEEMGEL